jgi:hypothetical protein
VRSAETCDLHDVKRSWCVSGSRLGEVPENEWIQS